ncbi:Latent-transforming growth factor beta-binding protein 4 [Trichoplax sp. H2]|nr:Latent-transforming growth factor beta-binding protein 4 [Trichoplax sp. H2]|eukprot:RDD45038.1 Latent-transforming growth factor beta-binding protein 4 [Trichoplax sp. H2]
MVPLRGVQLIWIIALIILPFLCHHVTTADCPVINSLRRGKIQGSGITPGTKLTFLCNQGYRLVGANETECLSSGQWSNALPVCKDINECKEGLAKCNVSSCINKNGFYQCQCAQGYVWNRKNEICTDINECSKKNRPKNCPDSRSGCTNLPGGFNCTCTGGYVHFNATFCQDINECTSNLYNNICNHSQHCINTEGSYQCICKQGYRNSSTTGCSDINECMESSHNCTSNQQCINVGGSYSCQELSLSSEELQKCAASNGSTCQAITQFQDGSVSGNRYSCGANISFTCNSGYYLTGRPILYCLSNGSWSHSLPNCSDVDECINNKDDCQAPAFCYNTVGSFQCQCPAGYKIDTRTTCQDIDECFLNTHKCIAPATCRNLPGNYECQCPNGYVLAKNKLRCKDINDCTKKNNPCHAQATCTNLPGSFNCTCNAGYTGDGLHCEDINECNSTISWPCYPHQTCENTLGSYKCDCQEGYRQINDTTCTDIDECKIGIARCFAPSYCQNLQGSFYCACPANSIQPTNCKKITCPTVTSISNGKVVGSDYSIFKSLVFSCDSGYELQGRHNITCMQSGNWSSPIPKCQDIDECKQQLANCLNTSYCVNTEGSYLCECYPGYETSKCIDINECEDDVCEANANCQNIPGSYICTCKTGFEDDGDECVDINECLESSICPTNTSCQNTIGSYKCSCSEGFRIENERCVDVNECLVDGLCKENTKCVNTIGSYSCLCLAGYAVDLEGVCKDLNECEQDSHECGANADCVNTVGSYECECKLGYSYDVDQICRDVNECNNGEAQCLPNEGCRNIAGSYLCICPNGLDQYEVGDGFCPSSTASTGTASSPKIITTSTGIRATPGTGPQIGDVGTIVGIALGSASFLVMISFGIWKIYKARNRSRPLINFDQTEMTTTAAFPIELEVVTDLPERKYLLLKNFGIEINKTIGRGAFGEVYKGVAAIKLNGKKSTHDVAVKLLRDTATLLDVSNFAIEIEVMQLLGNESPHIIKMLHCCHSSELSYIVMEYAEHGDLLRYLRSHSGFGKEGGYVDYTYIARTDKDLSSTEMTKFIWQIAQAMHFLESKLIIHRDLAARNILLATDSHDGMVCRLSDFGLARDVSKIKVYHETNKEVKLPMKWMAYESIRENLYSIKSDRWSFGILMWEIITFGGRPYSEFRNPRQLRSAIISGHRLAKPDHCSDEIFEIMTSCWDANPDNRPSFSTLLDKLDEIINDTEGYLSMDQFDPTNYVYLDFDDEDENLREDVSTPD